MNTAYLLTGANLGDRMASLTKARELLQQFGPITATSAVYETAAWGKTDQPSFLNQALALQTELNAKQLIRRILKVEKQMGRIREEKYGPRLIDIDILLFNDEVHQYGFLQLPHPELANRRFALLPLAEIAADTIHPLMHKPIRQLLAECPDTLEVTTYTE